MSGYARYGIEDKNLVTTWIKVIMTDEWLVQEVHCCSLLLFRFHFMTTFLLIFLYSVLIPGANISGE